MGHGLWSSPVATGASARYFKLSTGTTYSTTYFKTEERHTSREHKRATKDITYNKVITCSIQALRLNGCSLK